MAKKVHRIQVFRYAQGSQGNSIDLGFIFRHGEVTDVPVEIRRGCCTPYFALKQALVVTAASEQRLLTPEGKDGDEFDLYLASEDRDPSGLYVKCEHCNGKGHTRVAS